MDKFSKQPDEVIDVDVSFAAWLARRPTVAPVDIDVNNDSGISIVGTPTLTDGVAKIVIGGGTDGEEYRFSVMLNTDVGLRPEGDFIIKIKAQGIGAAP